MIIYIEKQAINYPQTQKIIEKFKNSSIIYIDNYKNIFDKDYTNLDSKKALIIAKLNSNSVSEAPAGYGHTKSAYFLKTSLNCVFDCDYCYLKGAFKNENMVIFVNYEDIKNELIEKIKTLPKDVENWFYSGDYSDIIGMDSFSNFSSEFIQFFEQFYNIKMEIRTKSANIKPLLDLGFIPKNTEIAFSLNPQSLIEKYEKGTSSLDSRIEAINKLLSLGFKVGIRFLPLLPVKNYEEIYRDFVEYVNSKINMCDINSTFASGLLYTKKDYNKILSKYKDLDILHMLELDNDGFYRESKKVRDTFYTMFKKLDNKCILCLEY
ncbi:MAG: radical SAM protein [Candidatus Gracilibacteria bacterium]|nr:radical SAM protein [Candidatus Gracilibacteria bacterium]